jgi:uncharacterized protein YjbI with pentapeptide repeats
VIELGGSKGDFADSNLTFVLGDCARVSQEGPARVKLGGSFARALLRLSQSKPTTAGEALEFDLSPGVDLATSVIETQAGVVLRARPARLQGAFKAAFAGPLLREGATWIPGGSLVIASGDDLDGFSLDGSVDTVTFEPARAERRDKPFRFARATLSNLTLPCQPGAVGERAFRGIKNVNTGLIETGASFAAATLRNVSMSGCILSYVSFANATLLNLNLQNSTLIGVNWENVAMDGLDLRRATLFADGPFRRFVPRPVARNVDLSNAIFNLEVAPRSQFQGLRAFAANLDDATFAEVVFGTSTFQNASMVRTNLSGAVLTGANLSGVLARQVVFRGARLDKVDMRDAWVSGAGSFAPVTTAGARFERSFFCDGALPAPQLSGATLAGAYFAFQARQFVFRGRQENCQAFSPFQGAMGSSMPTTSADTVCPNNSSGPCTLTEQWAL